MYFSFSNPSYLVILFVIPVLIFFHFYNIRNLRGRSLSFANFDAIAKVKGIDLYSKNIVVLTLNIIIIITLVFSLSGLTMHKEMEVSSFSFVIAIDISQSMGATDVDPDRLTAAKDSTIYFIDSLPYKPRVGILSFAGNAYIDQDITESKDEIEDAINNIEITEFGGTDIFEAISIASFMLDDEENKAIILFSDGQMNVGNTGEIIEHALKRDIIIHTFGVGTLSGGITDYGFSRMDEEILRSLSYSTEGQYFKVTSIEDLKESFDTIAPLTTKVRAIDLSFFLLIATVVLFILQQFLVDVIKIRI